VSKCFKANLTAYYIPAC